MMPIDQLVDGWWYPTDSHTFHDDFRPREAVRRRPTHRLLGGDQNLYFSRIQITGKGTHPESSETIDRLAGPNSASLTIKWIAFCRARSAGLNKCPTVELAE